MKNRKLIVPSLVVLIAALVWSCSGEKSETFTRGTLAMITAEDVYPVINIQVVDFQRMYEEAKVTNRSLSTKEALVQLLNDSVKLVVCARELLADERQFVERNDLEVDSTKIAYDGVAVVVNEKNGLTQLTTDALTSIVSGETDRWTAVKSSKLSSAVVVAMGDPNSGVHEFVRARLLGERPLTPNFLPCSTTTAVFAAVQERPNVIGIVGVSWLGSMPPGIRVLELGDPAFRRDSTVTETEYFGPHQAHLYRKYYPLWRPIYIYTRNAGKGVARGFTAFAASSDGQKIIVSNGLVPATMPVRLVQLNTP